MRALGRSKLAHVRSRRPRQQLGMIALLPEVQVAAELWLMGHSPATLANDFEAVLGVIGRVYANWHAPCNRARGVTVGLLIM